MRAVLLLFLLFPILLFGQKQGQERIDSLLSEVPKANEDTGKVNLLNGLSINYCVINPDTGIKFGQEALAVAVKLNWKKGMACAHYCISENYVAKSGYQQALESSFTALTIYDAYGDTSNEEKVTVLNLIVSCYTHQKNFKEAMRYEFRALEISKYRKGNFNTGVLFGIFLFITLYNLFLFYSIGDKSIKYVVLMVVLSFFILFFAGIRVRNSFEDYISVFGFVFAVSKQMKTHLKFIYNFMDEYGIAIFSNAWFLKSVKLCNVFFYANMVAFSLLYILNIDSKTEGLFFDVLFQLCTFVMLVEMILLLILIFKKGLYKNNGIRFIVLAQGVLFSSIFFVNYFHLSEQLIGFSVAAFVLLLSISVADKINYLKIKKATAQEEAIALLIANERINALLKEQELQLVSDMLGAQESERKRIASDLHDRLGSMLSTVKLYFGSVEEQIDKMKEQNREQYHRATLLLDEACDEVRKISHDLVSGELIKFGLVPALNQLAKTIEETGRLKMKVLAFGMDSRLESSAEIALYRIVQELLNNVLRHSKATIVTLQLNKIDNDLNIVLEDNGIGFDVVEARATGGMGLKNMESRAHSLKGTISFDSAKDKGTTVIIDIPV